MARVGFQLPSGRAEKRSGWGGHGQRSMPMLRVLTCCGCLSEVSAVNEASSAAPPQTRASQVARSEAQGHGQWGRLFFAYFLLATQKKVGAPPGAYPGQPMHPTPQAPHPNPLPKGAREKKVKPTDTPDSVRTGCPARDRHQSGPPVARTARCHLPASSPCGPQGRKRSRGEPRRCRGWPIWCCCAQRLPVSPGLNRLVSVALILTLGPLQGCRWRGVTSCAVLCSPDVPPVRPFGACTSGGLAGFTDAIIAGRVAHGAQIGVPLVSTKTLFSSTNSKPNTPRPMATAPALQRLTLQPPTSKAQLMAIATRLK